ncbi:MAG TPA: M50 family metallopeptidase [Kofleriaceae bacterium]
MYYVASLLSLAFLIVVHESGHFFVARWCRMRIERFSIGFGPGIIKRTSKKTGTVFQIAPIPFGGFVEIRGMNIAEDIDPDDKFAYPNRPAWQRFVTIFAGPATNYVSAIVLAFFLYNCHGQESSWHWHEVAAIRDGYDAKGKLALGDRIVAVEGVPILARGEWVSPDGKQYTADSLTRRVNEKKGQPVTLTVMRGGKPVDVTITPSLVFRDLPYAATPTYLLGIVPIERADVIEVGIFTSAASALEYPVRQTKMIAGGLYDIIRGEEKADPGGPKRIFDEFAKAWQLGPLTGIQLLMLLSVYLGMFNLLPLPALDGGRLVFLTYELVTRHRANPKIEAMVHMAGIMILGVVMILVTLNDFHVF